MHLIVYFLFNLIFYRFFFYLEESKNPPASSKYFESIASDLEKIGFYFEVSLNYNLISILLTSIITFLSYGIIKKSFSFSNLNNLKITFVKLISLSSALLLGFLYFLRGYNFSRFYLLVVIIFYPILIFIINFLLSKYKFSKFVLLILFFLTGFYLLTSIISKNAVTVSLNERESEEISLSSDKIVGLEYNKEGQCNEWIGSQNFNKCTTGATFTVVDTFGVRLSNLIFYNQELFILQSSGEIYKYNLQSFEKDLFLDLSEKVFYKQLGYFESGLFSLAFHPNKEYFLVSYSDLDNNLRVEKYDFKADSVDTISSKIITTIPSSDGTHYSGNLIWSNFFNDFLLSVGDMGYKFNSSDTTTPKGKVLLLNTQGNIEIPQPPLISDSENTTPLENVIAYGLRNPWKTFEHDNYLFIPDIGYQDMEELNIITLSDFENPIYFGWPIYEGIKKSSDEFFPVSYWTESGKMNLNVFAEEFTTLPKLYYDHNSPDVYRAAIIGGDVVNQKDSKFYNNYIFADYLSKELFSYDFINDQLSILPLPNEFDTYISSLIINPFEIDKALITTGNGELIEIKLP